MKRLQRRRWWNRGSPAKPPCRLTLENLEDRVLLSFLPRVNYDVGAGPYFVATGVLTSSGKVDIVTSSDSGYGVSVLLGNGDGTFKPRVDFDTSPFADSVAIADFNGDNIPDLAVATNSGVDLLLGNGDGTFKPATHVEAGISLTDVKAAHLHDPMIWDLVVSNNFDNTVRVVLGNGNGTFKPSVPYTVGTSPQYMSIKDLDGDGINDIAVAQVNSVSLLFGNGDGTFKPPTTLTNVGSAPNWVTAYDLKADGKVDLVVINQTTPGKVTVRLGNGDGTFQDPVSYTVGNGPTGVAVADFNHDGFVDLVVTNISGSVSLLLGNGDGTFQPKTDFAVGGGPMGVATADFNADGWMDVVTANYFDDNVSVLINDTMWSPRQPPPSSPPGARSADLDQTGVPSPAAVTIFFGSNPGERIQQLNAALPITIAPDVIAHLYHHKSTGWPEAVLIEEF